MQRMLALTLLAFLTCSLPSSAQSSPAVMTERIDALERQLRLMQRRLSGEQVDVSVQPTTSSGNVSDRRLLADLSARLGTLDRQIRQLNGRLEEFEYRQNEMAETLEQLRTQMAVQREQQLASGGPSVAPNQALPEPSPVQPTDASGGEQLATLPTEPEVEVPTVQLPEGTAAERYDYAFVFVRSNDLDSGRIAMEQFLDAHAGDPQAANAKFWLGRIHMQQGRNAEAAQMFLSLIEEHPNHSRRADSLVDLSDVLIRLEAPEDACNALAEFRRIEDQASARLKANARRVSDRARCNLF